jgi:small subunit ribosomal protein S1
MTQEERGGGPHTDQTMEDLLSQGEYAYQRPKRGEIRTGAVVLVGPNEIVVDVGAKREGVVSSQDLERLSPEERAAISVGDEISVYVVNPEDRDGNTIVSIHLAQIEQDWQKAEGCLASKEIFEGSVIGYNKGGLVVPFGRIRAFVPASQITSFPRRLSPEQRIERLSQQVGREIIGQIIEVDRRRKRLIMSEQAAQSEWRELRRSKVMDSLVEGQVVHGVVTSLANFGAFVDLGGTDGLIHISELSWHRVRHPREVVQVGDEVDVYVLKLDRAHSRIGLSLRRLQPDPWSLVDTKYYIDQRVAGRITNITDFGAFAHLEDGIEGLIHISELSDAEINHPSEVVRRGEEYMLEIIKIEPERQRIGLSLKRVSPEEQAAWRAEQKAPAPDTEPDTEPSAEERLEASPIAEDEAQEASAPDSKPEAEPSAEETLEASPIAEDEAEEALAPDSELDTEPSAEETLEASPIAEDEAQEAPAPDSELDTGGTVEPIQVHDSPPEGTTDSDNLPADASSADDEPQPEPLTKEPVA